MGFMPAMPAPRATPPGIPPPGIAPFGMAQHGMPMAQPNYGMQPPPGLFTYNMPPPYAGTIENIYIQYPNKLFFFLLCKMHEVHSHTHKYASSSSPCGVFLNTCYSCACTNILFFTMFPPL
jgi:hypothetical protein